MHKSEGFSGSVDGFLRECFTRPPRLAHSNNLVLYVLRILEEGLNAHIRAPWRCHMQMAAATSTLPSSPRW